MTPDKEEMIAAYVHDMRSGWYKYQRDFPSMENIKRREIQSETPYEQLSDEDKAKDMVFAKIIYSLIDKEC